MKASSSVCWKFIISHTFMAAFICSFPLLLLGTPAQIWLNWMDSGLWLWTPKPFSLLAQHCQQLQAANTKWRAVMYTCENDCIQDNATSGNGFSFCWSRNSAYTHHSDNKCFCLPFYNMTIVPYSLFTQYWQLVLCPNCASGLPPLLSSRYLLVFFLLLSWSAWTRSTHAPLHTKHDSQHRTKKVLILIRRHNYPWHIC